MENQQYHFMWGQRQSLMLMETSVSALGPESALMTQNIKESLQVVERGIVSSYMTDQGIAAWRKNSPQYFDHDFTDKLFSDIHSLIKEFFLYSAANRTKNLAELSNPELADLIARQRYFVLQGLIFFATSTPGATWAVEQKMRQILEAKLGNDQRVQEYFIALTTPAAMDETMRERINFIALAKRDEVANDDLLSFAYQYPAMFLNTYDETDVLSFLRNRLEEYKRSEELMSEGQTINENIATTAAKHKEIHNQIKSDELEYLASIIQHAALGRYQLKHVWNGSEFANLPLLREVAHRIKVTFNDLTGTYTFSDIDHFLRQGTKLSAAEIAARLECVVLHWINGTVKQLFGQEAIEYKNRLIEPGEGKISDQSQLTGQVASVGKAKGRARVVFVEDLKQFLKDSAAFQSGEILVTTMTSPIMMPIITKAAGIVTDEGGIASHAAVSAREFKIPCIVGTRNGTKVIKTGDEIEVDANKGIIKIMR